MILQHSAIAERYGPALSRPTPEPAARKLGRESVFGVHPLRLFNRKVRGHLIDPRRHAIGQGPFDGEIGRMPSLTRGKLGYQLFGSLLGGRKLRLKRIDMGFERPDDLVGQRSFVHNAGAQSAIV